MTMSRLVATSGPGAIDELEPAFLRVLESEALRSAPVSRSLLLFLWNHRNERLSEYAVAVDGLGRSSGFDPKSDATVRVQIARLRTKLKEFYEGEGQDNTLRLQIPLGTHELQWSYDQPDPHWLALQKKIAVRYPWLTPALAVLCLVLTVSSAVLVARSLRGEQNAGRKTSVAPEIWAPLLANGRPTTLVLPNSTGFHWDKPGVTVLEPGIASFHEWQNSSILGALGANWGPPSLNQVYTVARHAVAGFRLLQFVGEHGGSAQVLEAADLAAESLAQQNTILLGSPNTGVQIRALMENLNFGLRRGGSPSLVVNKMPQPGEPAQFEETEMSRERRVVPGIIVWLPKRPEGSQTLLLVGRWTTGLATMLTSTEGLRTIKSELRKIGTPEGWEMVVESEVQADTTVLRNSPVAVRAIPATYWK